MVTRGQLIGVNRESPSQGVQLVEEENVGVTETQSPEAVAPATESDSLPSERQEDAQERRKRNDVEYNWAEARRKMQELERITREQQEVINRIQKPSSNEEDDLGKLSDEDILTVAQAKKLVQKIARSSASEIIKQREAATVDERLQLKFPDYTEVVSQENVELLKQTEPELALSLSHSPDPYSQGVAAYKLIKKLVGNQSASNSLEKKKAVENAQKPISVNAVSKTTAIGNAHLFENGLTPELKSQLWKEMQTAIKSA